VSLNPYREAIMTDMGTFRTTVELENTARPGERQRLCDVLVDTGAELSWFRSATLEALGIERRKQLRFRQANGTVLTRWTGAASIYVGDRWTADEVVFGEPGDLVLLGARSLEGLNVHVDLLRKMLVDAGPMPAAAAA
jgi:predicted aspartyl protease